MTTYTPKEARDKILAGTAPDYMAVNGYLDLSKNKELTELPKGLRVEGWLGLKNCTALKALPDDLIVIGCFYLDSCTALTELSKGLRVDESLHLHGCILLTELSDGLKVGSSIDLTNCTSLTHLPKGLRVKGSLYLGGCIALIKLPDGLRVEGSLSLRDCTALTKLPEGLNVGNYIFLNHPLVIPDTVQCGGFVFRGVQNFPREFISNPQSITAADVLNEWNAQKRSVLLELMGIQRFMREANPVIVHQDIEHNGNVRQLLRVGLPVLIDGRNNSPIREEPIVMLSVTCPSTGSHYMLRVPPDMQTCHQAAAWIAGFDDPELYKPVLET
jgi:hypothetical protein